MNETSMKIVEGMVVALDWSIAISVVAALVVLIVVLLCAMKIALGHIWQELKSTPGMIIREFKTNKYFFF